MEQFTGLGLEIAAHCDSHTQHPHTHTVVYGPFSGTTWVSRYEKGNTNLDFLKQETVSGSGISWAVFKFAPQ